MSRLKRGLWRPFWILISIRLAFRVSSFREWAVYSLFPKRWDKKMRPEMVTGIQNGIRTVKVHVSFEMSRWKETCNKHSCFRFVFWWLFQISFIRENLCKLGNVTEKVMTEETLFKEKWWDREISAGRGVGLSLQGMMPYVPWVFPSWIQWHRSKTSWSIAHIALSLVPLGAQLSQTPAHSLIYINRELQYPHQLEELWIRRLIDAFSSHPHYGCHGDAWSRYKYK